MGWDVVGGHFGEISECSNGESLLVLLLLLGAVAGTNSSRSSRALESGWGGVSNPSARMVSFTCL